MNEWITIQEGNSHNHTATAVVVVEVDAFWNVTADHTQQNRSFSLVARLFITEHGMVALMNISRLDEHKFMIV